MRRRLHERLPVRRQRELGAEAHVAGVADLDRPPAGGEAADVRPAVGVGEHRGQAPAALGREIDQEDLGAGEIPPLGVLDLDLEGRGSAPLLAGGETRQEESREKKGCSSHRCPESYRRRSESGDVRAGRSA